MFTDKVHRQWISLGVETTGSIPVSCPIFWYWHIYSFSSNNKRDKAYICLLSTLNQMPCTMAVANHPSGSRMASKPYDLPSQDHHWSWIAKQTCGLKRAATGGKIQVWLLARERSQAEQAGNTPWAAWPSLAFSALLTCPPPGGLLLSPDGERHCFP